MKIGYSREKLEDLFAKGRKKIISIIIIILTLIIVLSIYGTQSKKIESLRAAKDAQMKKNEVLQQIAQSEKTIKLYKELVGKKDAYTVMNTIDSIVKESSVRLISLKPETERGYPLYIEYPFSLVVATNSYHAIGKFISNIENHPDIFFIDAMSIKANGENQAQEGEPAQASKPTEKLTVNLTLTIIAFKN